MCVPGVSSAARTAASAAGGGGKFARPWPKLITSCPPARNSSASALRSLIVGAAVVWTRWERYISSLPAHAHIAGAPGDALLVEVFEEGDGVLARGLEEVAQVGDGDAAARVNGRQDLRDHALVGRAVVDDAGG